MDTGNEQIYNELRLTSFILQLSLV